MSKLMVTALWGVGMQSKRLAQSADGSQNISSSQFPKKYSVTYQDLERDIEKMYIKLPKHRWDGIIAIARGGLYPTLLLAHKLGIRRIECLSLASYDDDKKQRNIEVLHPFGFKEKNEGLGWIIVDDLSDTGNTLIWLKKYLPKAHYAVIYTKTLGKHLVDTYGTEVEQGTWIEFPWEK